MMARIEDFKIKPQGRDYPGNYVPNNPFLTEYLTFCDNLRDYKTQDQFFEKVDRVRLRQLSNALLEGVENSILASNQGSTDKPIGRQRLIKVLNQLLLEFWYIDSTLNSYSLNFEFKHPPGSQLYHYESTSFLEAILEVRGIYGDCIGSLAEYAVIYHPDLWKQIRSNSLIASRFRTVERSKLYPNAFDQKDNSTSNYFTE